MANYCRLVAHTTAVKLVSFARQLKSYLAAFCRYVTKVFATVCFKSLHDVDFFVLN